MLLKEHVKIDGDTVTFTFTVTDTVTSNTAEAVTSVAVSPPATAETGPEACMGDEATLAGGPDGMAGYEWTGPAGVVFDTTKQSPSLPPATPAIVGTYELTVTDNCGNADTAQVEIIAVNDLVPAMGPIDCRVL